MRQFNICLALSGGGFRASLFHLGLIRFLRDTKLADGTCLLSRVGHICSVSGGSVIAAHLLRNWSSYTSPDEQRFEAAAAKFIAFARSDVRGQIMRRFPYRQIIPAWGRVEFLKNSYDALYNEGDADNAGGTKPLLHILATNLTTGSLWSFDEDSLRVYDAVAQSTCAAPTLELSQKVAASSAFPGFFPPIRFRAADLALDEKHFQPSEQFITDGGVYDNLGIRRAKLLVDEEEAKANPISLALVSDAGSAFDFDVGKKLGLVGTALRSVDILMDRVGRIDLEVVGWRDARTQGDTLPGLYRLVSIKSEVSAAEDRHAQNQAVQRSLKFIRTDFDQFSEQEIVCLVRHGYCVGRQFVRQLLLEPDNKTAGDVDLCALKSEAPTLPDGPPWLPASISKTRYPNPTPAALAAKHLKAIQLSKKLSLRLFEARDYMSYINGAVAVSLLLILSVGCIRGWRQCKTWLSPVNAVEGWGYDAETKKFGLDVARSVVERFRTKKMLLGVAFKSPEDRTTINRLKPIAVSDLKTITESGDLEVSIDCQKIASLLHADDYAEGELFLVPPGVDPSTITCVQDLLDRQCTLIGHGANLVGEDLSQPEVLVTHYSHMTNEQRAAFQAKATTLEPHH